MTTDFPTAPPAHSLNGPSAVITMEKSTHASHTIFLTSPAVTMRDLLEAGVHFGHQTRFWSPKMAPYIFGARNKIYIVNLEKTLAMYNEAMAFVKTLASNRGTILFVGTKRQAREIISEEAKRAGAPYVDQRWLDGMLINFKTVKTSIKRLKDMEQAVEAGELERIPKKEALAFRREMEKQQKSIGGIKDMADLPDAIFVVDVGYHKAAISEAEKLGIPVIGVVDTNHSPEGVSYVIPGNDDSSRAIHLYARGVADAILEGRSQVIEYTELAKALARGTELQEHLFYSEEMLTDQEFSQKRAVFMDDLINIYASNAVLCLPHPTHPNLFAYPKWQLNLTVAKVLPDILEILKTLSPWAKWHFFHTSHPVLLELSPLEAWGIPSAVGRGRSYSDRTSSLRDKEGSVGEAIKRAASAYVRGQD